MVSRRVLTDLRSAGKVESKLSFHFTNEFLAPGLSHIL